MNIRRRQFIKLGAATTAGLPWVGLSSCLSRETPSGKTSDKQADRNLYQIFKDPENKHRVFVRWWWNGDRLTEKEILRELDVMQAAGIGGVEINPIRFPDNAEPIGIPSIEWLSDPWLAMLKVALTGAQKRGMVCDIIVGSGWPFGGEFLTREEQTQQIALGTVNLPGGKTYRFTQKELLDSVNPDFHSKYENKAKELVGIRLVPRTVRKLEEYTDLTSQLSPDGITVQVPAGEYVLYYLVKITGFMAVINGAPGANGPVLNHYSKPAVEKFLNRMSARITEKIGPMGNYLRACFTDSLELEGANWCDDLFEQFQQRKGYDLSVYFPYLLFKVGEMGNAVTEEYGAVFTPSLQQRIQRARYDFEEVRVQLFRERFIDTFNDWCKANGVQSRMQAYGRECHPLEASMLIDIPECETWLGFSDGEHFSDEDYRVGRAYLMCNKYVSSGARLAGKTLVSCEELTNTSMVFNASLDTIKVAGDQSTLSGVTHSILHGFNYSPLEAPFPGWIRYGTFLNERNPWWPYFRRWADYKARLSALFQQAELQANVAILHPLADLEKHFGFQRDPFPKFAYPVYQHQVWEAIHQNGGGCDYTSEAILQQSAVKGGKLTFGPRSYQVLMLLDVESLQSATAAKIKAFAEAGGKVIFVGKLPRLSTSLTNGDAEDTVVAETMQALASQYSATVGRVEAPQTDFVAWYRRIQETFAIQPFVSLDKPNKFVSQVYYRHPEADIFFFANYNTKKEHRFTAVFPASTQTAWLWDPESGQRYRLPLDQANRSLPLVLGPSESKLIVFSNEKEGDTLAASTHADKEGISISTPWTVTLNPVAGPARTFELDTLVDFSKREDLKAFAGVIEYENAFSVDKNAGHSIDLGQVYGVSELEINGKPAGTKWYGRHVYDVSTAVKPGRNTIRIRLTTTLGNYMKSLKDNKVAMDWTNHQPLYPMGLLGPVSVK